MGGASRRRIGRCRSAWSAPHGRRSIGVADAPPRTFHLGPSDPQYLSDKLSSSTAWSDPPTGDVGSGRRCSCRSRSRGPGCPRRGHGTSFRSYARRCSSWRHVRPGSGSDGGVCSSASQVGCPAQPSCLTSGRGRRSWCPRWSSPLRLRSPGPDEAADGHRGSTAPDRRANARPRSALTPSDAPPSISPEVACVRQIHRTSVSDLSADWRRGG